MKIKKIWRDMKWEMLFSIELRTGHSMDEIGKILAKITIVYPDKKEKTVKMAYGSFLYDEIEKQIPETEVLEGCYDEKDVRIEENASISEDRIIRLKFQETE